MREIHNISLMCDVCSKKFDSSAKLSMHLKRTRCKADAEKKKNWKIRKRKEAVILTEAEKELVVEMAVKKREEDETMTFAKLQKIVSEELGKEIQGQRIRLLMVAANKLN